MTKRAKSNTLGRPPPAMLGFSIAAWSLACKTLHQLYSSRKRDEKSACRPRNREIGREEFAGIPSSDRRGQVPLRPVAVQRTRTGRMLAIVRPEAVRVKDWKDLAASRRRSINVSGADGGKPCRQRFPILARKGKVHADRDRDRAARFRSRRPPASMDGLPVAK